MLGREEGSGQINFPSARLARSGGLVEGGEPATRYTAAETMLFVNAAQSLDHMAGLQINSGGTGYCALLKLRPPNLLLEPNH